MTENYRQIPVFLVCGPSMAWPGEFIYAIFYTEEEANTYIKSEYNPFLYIRIHSIFVDDSRSTATE
jgi:hypothetical protein